MLRSAILALALLAALCGQAAAGDVRVIDGDKRVRLWGIDAVEMRQTLSAR